MWSTQTLFLRNNQIGDVGMQALSTALAGGALPACSSIGIDGNPASEAVQQAVEDAIGNRQ